MFDPELFFHFKVPFLLDWADRTLMELGIMGAWLSSTCFLFIFRKYDYGFRLLYYIEYFLATTKRTFGCCAILGKNSRGVDIEIFFFLPMSTLFLITALNM